MSEKARSVSIVTQTSVWPECADAFARWQGDTSTTIAKFPGFIEQRLMPPSPPLQVDWVILQRFVSLEDAKRWLASPERQARLEGVASMLVGRDDVHIVQEDAGTVRSSPVSAVISTRVRPGKEAEYRAWERKIAAVQSKAPGLQGYRFEPSVPGVQEDFVAILRFDSEAHLQDWLDSPERKKLVEEAEPFTEEWHARIARTGFEQWFREDVASQAPSLPVWKMDMLVLLILYPIVFLFGVLIGTPLLNNAFHLPFAIALFFGNIVSVGLTGFLVPWIAERFDWWLRPPNGKDAIQTNLLGGAIILTMYAAMAIVFWRLF